MAQQHRRRKYWVDIRMQGPFLLKIGAVWTGGILLLCLLLYFLADEELGRSFYSVHLRIRNTWEILLPAVLVSGGISFLATIGVTVLVAVRESHRLGGPVFKFTRLFRELEEGSFDPGFHFREGDLLAPLGESYRVALESNRKRMAEMQSLGRNVEASLSGLRETIGSREDLPWENTRLTESLEQVTRLRKMLDSFHLGTK